MKSEPEIEPDERLRLALRHAPDAALGAPAQLQAWLSAAARRATAPALRRRWWQPTPLRWAGAGVFASAVMAALLVRAPAPEPTQPDRVTAQAPGPAPAAPVATIERRLDDALPAPRPAAAPLPRTKAMTNAAPAASLPELAPPLQVALAPEAAAPQPLAAAREAREAREPRAAGATSAAGPTGATGATRSRATLAAEPLADRAEAPLRWRIAGAAPAVANADWLRQALVAPAGAWQPAATAPPPDALIIELLRGEALQQRLFLADDALWSCDAGAACRRRDAARETMRALKESLPR